MKTQIPTSLRPLHSSMILVSAIIASSGRSRLPAASVLTPAAPFAVPVFAAPPTPTPVVSFKEMNPPRFAPDAFLSSRGRVRVELPWAANLPDGVFAFLFGATKAQAAQIRYAEKVRSRKVERIHDAITLTTLTDPVSAKVYRNEFNRALSVERLYRTDGSGRIPSLYPWSR